MQNSCIMETNLMGQSSLEQPHYRAISNSRTLVIVQAKSCNDLIIMYSDLANLVMLE